MIVTISAAYAAGGSQIGPRVAQRLGVEFVDRAVPVAVAEELGITVEDAQALEQNGPSRLWSFLAGMSSVSGMAVAAPVEQPLTDQEVIKSTEGMLHRIADRGSAVILGHAAAVVLRERDDVLHVRFDGDPKSRVRAAMTQHGLDLNAASKAQKDNDKIRSGYVRHFYHADSASPVLYHLVFDTVRLDWELVEELIVQVAQSANASGT